MGEGLLVQFPGPGPLLVCKDVPALVPGERHQTGLYKPYSSVLQLQLNEGEKKGVETPLLGQAEGSAQPQQHPTHILYPPPPVSARYCPPRFSHLCLQPPSPCTR